MNKRTSVRPAVGCYASRSATHDPYNQPAMPYQQQQQQQRPLYPMPQLTPPPQMQMQPVPMPRQQTCFTSCAPYGGSCITSCN